MKIGIVGSMCLSVPPETYGRTENIEYTLANVSLNFEHEVTLFGVGKAKIHKFALGWEYDNKGNYLVWIGSITPVKGYKGINVMWLGAVFHNEKASTLTG